MKWYNETGKSDGYEDIRGVLDGLGNPSLNGGKRGKEVEH